MCNVYFCSAENVQKMLGEFVGDLELKDIKNNNRDDAFIQVCLKSFITFHRYYRNILLSSLIIIIII